MGGLEWSPTGYDVAKWNFQRMQSWGVNFVRVALSDTYWLKAMCTYDSKYQSRVDNIVRWGQQLKILILLDNHHGTEGQTCGTGKWHNLMKLPDIHNLAFIKQLATRYKNNPYVAFDIYNEPHDVSDALWRNGGVVDGYRGVGMQQLLDGVRSTGAKNLVVVSGNQWGADLRPIVNNPLSNDKDVVYGAHQYPYWCYARLVHNEPYVCDGHRYSPSLNAYVLPAIGRRPVMLTEFGTYRPFAAEVAEPIEWAEQHHIGWSTWLWCNGPVSEFCLLSPTGGTTPSVIGQPVRDALRRATGK
jgi:hypothetical protein